MHKKTVSVEYAEFADLEEMDAETVALIEEAIAIAKKSYSPYSKFPVGAAVLLDDGQVFAGNNQENIAFPSGTCAERSVLNYVHGERQRLAVVELERKVEALKIRSPIDGLVGTLAVADRANVAANAPIATVVDLSRFEVEIEIPEVYSDDIGLGMAAEVRIGSEQHAGILGSISPEVVDGQVRGRVRFSGEQPPGLRQSQRVTARLVIEEKPDVLMVQRGPFFDADAGRFAYVVADGTAVRRPIRTGATSMTAVEILDGLRAGESIIVSDTTDFRGAQRVNLN